MKDVRILEAVSVDIVEAANWYDEQGHPGLGDRFLETFYAYIPHLQNYGEIHRKVYSDFRRVLLKPFPYALYYRYFEGLLVVSLVIHAVRDPKLVRALLRERKA
jgi:hypothetical protein